MKPAAGALFWKLFASLWFAMLVSFGCAFTYLWAIGFQPPPDRVGPPRLLPWVTAASMSLLFSAGTAWYLSGPLRHLRWGLRRAAEERFDTRVKPLMGRRRDEIVDLAGEFDLMAARLEQLTAMRRTLLHDLSHELRSPLARLQVAIGLWRQTPDDGAQLAARVEREVERLDGLVEELLTLHRLESADGPGGEPLVLESVDLCELLETIVADASFEAQATGRRVVLDNDGEFIAQANADLIYRALENVIRNAVKYTPAGTDVDVQARRDASGTVLAVTVADRGPGVPSDKLGAIFEPFVRLDASSSSRSTGLGLALARRAVVSHGGRIGASLRSGGGLLVSIDIPAARATLKPAAALAS